MPRPVRYSRNPWWMAALVSCCLLELCGCSLFVMAGKMLQGDPVVDDEFKRWYGKSLSSTGKDVVILCSTPESVKSEYSSLDLDLISEVSSRLRQHEISVVKSHRVASWVDDHGGGEVNVKELGEDLNADFVVHIKLDDYSFREENSPGLLRGRTSGLIVVYELIREESKDKEFGDAFEGDDSRHDSEKKTSMKDSDRSEKSVRSGDKSKTKSKIESTTKRRRVSHAKEVFTRNFNLTYPQLQPVAEEQMDADNFCKKFVDHVADYTARFFYRHKAGSDI